MKYGIKNVVSGFAHKVKDPLPYAIARTVIEIDDIDWLMKDHAGAR